MSKGDQIKQDGVTPQPLPPAVEVRWAAYGKLTLYPVDEGELELLAQGSPDSLYLNFAIFLLSTAISFLIALLTLPSDPKVGNGISPRFVVFIVVTSVGFLGGTFLLLLWLKKRRSISNLVRKIKDRLPPEGIQEIKPDSES